MPAPISIAVHGASGRMGQSILRLARADQRFEIAAALGRAGSAREGRSIAAVDDGETATGYTASFVPGSLPLVLIDFSTAEAFDDALRRALEMRCAFVSGTTGIDARQRSDLNHAATSIPVLWSANFSLGVAVLSRLVEDAARALRSWDCEITEAHHVGKRDAPSGTALALGRCVADAREQKFDDVAVLPRDATPVSRGADSIGFAVTRDGDIVGEHTVTFATLGERVELAHRASDRDIFARGALVAALWIAGREPGSFSMADVLHV